MQFSLVFSLQTITGQLNGVGLVDAELLPDAERYRPYLKDTVQGCPFIDVNDYAS